MSLSHEPYGAPPPTGHHHAAQLALSLPHAVPATHRLACQRVREIASELFLEIVDRDMVRRDRRHALMHIRQIALYVCHVTLSLPLVDVAPCFGRHPSTASLTCQGVEDRRDDPGFDAFVTAVEEKAKSILETILAGAHD